MTAASPATWALAPARTPAAPTPAEQATVAALRAFARRAQLSPPIDQDLACAQIDPPADRAAEAYGAALMRALDRGALRRVALHAAGAPSLGERWLLALLRAVGAGDHASASFLVGRWVARSHRRPVLFLTQRLSRALEPPEDRIG